MLSLLWIESGSHDVVPKGRKSTNLFRYKVERLSNFFVYFLYFLIQNLKIFVTYIQIIPNQYPH